MHGDSFVFAWILLLSIPNLISRKETYTRRNKTPAWCEIWGHHSDVASGVATVEQEYATARGPQAHRKNFLTK